jgi:hypothetical protein
MNNKAKWEVPSLRCLSASDARSGITGAYFDANWSKGGTIPMQSGHPAVLGDSDGTGS